MIEIDNLIKESLKNKQTIELKAYRNLNADILKFKTQKNAPELTEDKLIQIISKSCKSLEDSIFEFNNAGREDLMLECREELEVLKKLLPEPVSLEKIYFTIEEHCQKYGWLKDGELAIPKKEMGKLIKTIKKELPNANSELVAKTVKENLI
jgi:uncharacterized protein YqeY